MGLLDSPTGTKTSLITTRLKFLKDKGPFPCTTDFPKGGANYHTLSDLLDAKAVTWKYYTPEYQKGTTGALWNAFDAIAAVRYGSEWGTNVSWPDEHFHRHLERNAAGDAGVIPDAVNSDHPGYQSDTGPSWVASVVNAVGQSPYWNSTAIVIVWDDWGGLYDPVAPPLIDRLGGLGFRVGMLVASPYTPQSSSCAGRGAVHTQYEFGGVKFIEETFNLGSLGTTDQRATSIANLFNFNQSPCPFPVDFFKTLAGVLLAPKALGLARRYGVGNLASSRRCAEFRVRSSRRRNRRVRRGQSTKRSWRNPEPSAPSDEREPDRTRGRRDPRESQLRQPLRDFPGADGTKTGGPRRCRLRSRAPAPRGTSR